MNWKQFKKLVEDQGVTDKTKIAWIVVDHEPTEVTVIRNVNGTVTLIST